MSKWPTVRRALVVHLVRVILAAAALMATGADPVAAVLAALAVDPVPEGSPPQP